MQNPQEEMMEVPPMAQYGMMTGDYSYPGDQFYRTGGALEKYQSKGEVKYDIPKDAVIINRGDYKTEDEYATARNEQFAKAGNKPVYIIMPDGKYKKLTQKTKARDPYTGEDLKSTWNNSQEIANTFKDMNMSINTPEFTKVLADYTLAAIKDKSKYIGKTGKVSNVYEEFKNKNFTPEEIRDAFIKHQKRNLALQAYGIKARYFEDAPTGRLLTPEQMVAEKVLNDNGEPIKLDEAKKMYDKYKSSDITDLKKAFEKVGIPLDNTALEQATFQGFTDALKNKEKLTKEEQAALANWKGYETGVADEIKQANAKISPIDRAYTNTTGEQLSSYNKPAETEFVETDVEGKPIEEATVAQEETPQVPYQGVPEWWLQDKVNMALAAGDYFNVQKALPFAPRYEPQYISTTFYNPDTELNAQTAQTNTIVKLQVIMHKLLMKHRDIIKH